MNTEKVHRRKLIEQILETFTPYFYDSDFVEGGVGSGKFKPIRLYVFAQARLISGYVIDEVIGLDAAGVITNALGGAMVTTYWSAIPVEDLLKLSKLQPEIGQ